MIALLQRVLSASVEIESQRVAAIDRGLLVMVGVRPEDRLRNAERLLDSVLGYRVFPDSEGRMNLSLCDLGLGLLLVPQFTLAADTAKGRRPGFSTAAAPGQAAELFTALVEMAQSRHGPFGCGRFGSDMQVALVNDGPVTLWLER